MREKKTLTLLTSMIALAAGVVAMTPQRADACGGTFCDAGPTSMPVDQTGENILFVMGDGFTEAHIQIQYDPDAEAEEFAWVVPLMEVPEFEVGSQPFFDQVLAGTVPSYGFQSQFTGEGCGDDDGFASGGGFPGSGGGGSSGGGGDDSGGADEPEVVLQTVVGAFEITVLSGGTADELVMWLDANGYQQDPAALPILEEYLAENYLFAAFKLVNDAETSDIHPIVLRFPVEEACIPLRLTRIAAVDDMDIRTFFLADHRVVPETYRHVVVNPLKLDWPSQASNYKEVITMAVDADQANGRAFVTEYAGRSDVVSTSGILGSLWDAAAFEDAPDAAAAILRLEQQGLLGCFPEFEEDCRYGHPLLAGVMAQYLPVPEGVTAAQYYDDPLSFEELVDPMIWDGLAFAALFDERIVVPGQHARTLLDSYPTLTRMYTTISPGEMSEDPFFHQNPDLPEVDLRNEIATRRFGCGSDEVWVLPGGREVYVPNGVWPAFPGEMPWEEDVQEIAMVGAPVALADRSALIDAELHTHNCQYDYPSADECGHEGGATGGTGSSAGGGQDGTGTGSGCGCRSTTPGGYGTLLLSLGLLGLGVRRRRA